MSSKGNRTTDKSNIGIGADGNIVNMFPFRGDANLHHSDPYWSSDLGYWVNKRGEYDDEANDDRPDNEKYTNGGWIMLILFIVFFALAGLLIWIFRSFPN